MSWSPRRIGCGTALRKRLDDTIRQRALPELGRALGRWARINGRDPTDDAVRAELERAARTLVFRALFPYAEAAGYLPMHHPPYRQASLSSLCEEAAESLHRLDPRSTSLWDRFSTLVKTMRSGNRAWDVPAYNGALFAARGFEGAATLERVELHDPAFGAMLAGIGRDLESGGGIDYSTLDIGHLGTIYEGLLSLRLTAAEERVRYDVRKDAYLPAQQNDADAEPGDLLWQTHEGGRKGGGVYYTPAALVRHLVRNAVLPTFRQHLEKVRQAAEMDPTAAAEKLLDFAVLDPACGSAHFLVTVVNELADASVRFLAETPLPSISIALDRLRVVPQPGRTSATSPFAAPALEALRIRRGRQSDGRRGSEAFSLACVVRPGPVARVPGPQRRCRERPDRGSAPRRSWQLHREGSRSVGASRSLGGRRPSIR